MIDVGKQLQDAYDEGYKQRDSEIVRCKDCAYSQGHFTNAPVKCGCGYGTHHEEFFCADAERRTDDA